MCRAVPVVQSQTEGSSFTQSDKSIINPTLINCSGNGKELSVQQPRELKTKYILEGRGERLSLWKHFVRQNRNLAKVLLLTPPACTVKLEFLLSLSE